MDTERCYRRETDEHQCKKPRCAKIRTWLDEYANTTRPMLKHTTAITRKTRGERYSQRYIGLGTRTGVRLDDTIAHQMLQAVALVSIEAYYRARINKAPRRRFTVDATLKTNDENQKPLTTFPFVSCGGPQVIWSVVAVTTDAVWSARWYRCRMIAYPLRKTLRQLSMSTSRYEALAITRI